MGKNLALTGLCACAITCFLKQYFSCEYFTAYLMLQHSKVCGTLWAQSSVLWDPRHKAVIYSLTQKCQKMPEIPLTHYTKVKLGAFSNHSVMEVTCSVYKSYVFIWIKQGRAERLIKSSEKFKDASLGIWGSFSVDLSNLILLFFLLPFWSLEGWEPPGQDRSFQLFGG